ncbi:hypothetical protein IQ07DRAFT_594950 [Pyrenochaeta sp. DS3sAY3a]|nr:hypothetical protein IQ07DRAFT_594950 [Pyrenochaeta sp. DS3sAY3a]
MTRPPKELNPIDPTSSNTSTPKRSPVTPKRWFNDYTPSPRSGLTPKPFYTAPTTSTPTSNPASTLARTHPAPFTPAPSPPKPASPAKPTLTPTPTPTPASLPHKPTSTPSPSTISAQPTSDPPNISAPPSPSPTPSSTIPTLPILNTTSDPNIQVGVFTGLGQRKPETLRRGMGVGREQALASRRAIRRLRDLCGGF